MFRIRDPQESLWQSQFLVTPKKAKRLERSWAEVFRNEALPLIDEERFAPMYCVDNGRPNRAVQTVLGVHLLKEMFNLTDDEALEQLEFNLLWHHALRLDIEETHLPQKTLHNFRVRLMQHDGGRLAFQETTDRIIQALGIRTGKQRLDSTHIMSNIATLTRLGLFCETMRLFLRALRWEHPELRPGVPEGLLVLQRQFREGCGVMPAWRRGAWHGSVWPVRYCPAYPQATAATWLARTVPGAAFPAPPGRPAAS